MISNTTIQLHAPDGLKANRNGEYKEVGGKKTWTYEANYLIIWLVFFLCVFRNKNYCPSKYNE